MSLKICLREDRALSSYEMLTNTVRLDISCNEAKKVPSLVLAVCGAGFYTLKEEKNV